MEEKELLRNISHLKEIKPREEWVFLLRQRIVEEGVPLGQVKLGFTGLYKNRFWGIVEGIGRMVRYMERPAFVMPALAVIVAGGAVGMAVSESLPGDKMFPAKAAAEQIYLRFAEEEERPAREFALTQQRLADLRFVAEQNKVKNLPLAIQEFEANASKISEEFTQVVENQPEKALQASRQIVELQKAKSEVEKILGTKIGEEHEDEIENATKRLVEYELAYLESRSLTQEQKELFDTAKNTAEAGDYPAALEHIWNLSQNITQEG